MVSASSSYKQLEGSKEFIINISVGIGTIIKRGNAVRIRLRQSSWRGQLLTQSWNM